VAVITGIESLRDRVTLSVPEAASLLGIGKNTAYDAARTGALPTIRLGSRLLVPVPHLLRLLGDAAGGAVIERGYRRQTAA
jgi:excisionase family DNA binding protein